MGNDASIQKLTGTGTTTLSGVSGMMLYNICINKTLTGTLTVNENGVAVGQFAIGTVPGNYHQHTQGVRYFKLTLVLSAGDDVSVLTKAL